MAPDDEGRPPVLGSWRQAYVLVLGVLALEVVLLSLLSLAFR